MLLLLLELCGARDICAMTCFLRVVQMSQCPNFLGLQLSPDCASHFDCLLPGSETVVLGQCKQMYSGDTAALGQCDHKKHMFNEC